MTILACRRPKDSADAWIADAIRSGANVRRVRRALAALFGGAVGKHTVSADWLKTNGDLGAEIARPQEKEPIILLILDGAVARVNRGR
jgi:hypothetical protein